MENKTKMRDYDKDPIIIKDYGAYFQASFLMLLISLLIFLWIVDLQNNRFQNMNIYSFNLLDLLLVFYFVYGFFIMHISFRIGFD